MNYSRIRTIEEFRRWLITHRACSLALQWVDAYDWPSLESIWGACPNYAWMIWVAMHRGVKNSVVDDARSAVARLMWSSGTWEQFQNGQADIVRELIPYSLLKVGR